MPPKKKYVPLDKTTRQLRWLSVAYLVLLVLEGALRKWALPGLSDVLLLVRDPIVLLAYAIAIIHRKFPINRILIAGLALMLLWVVATLLLGHQNLFVTAFGFRVNYLHVPFAIIMGKVLYRSDVIIIGRWWLWATVAMTVLIVLQFSSPQSAWVNLSVGGSEGAGFSGAMGKFRPPGTFSFIIGIVWFYTFSMAFLISGITQHRRYSKLLLALSAIAILIAIPVSISRMLIFSVGFTFVVGLCASALQKGSLSRYFRILIFLSFGLFIANQISVFDEAKEAFLSRWEHSTSKSMGGIRGSIIERTLNEFIGPFAVDEEIPFVGKGIGAGTQAGTQMLSGQRGFSLGEGEWFRITGEGGILIGALYICWRIWLAVILAKHALFALYRGNGLGLIFLSATIYNLLIGQIGQTTVLGFTIIGIGLTIASMRARKTITTTSTTTSSSETSNATA